MKILHVCLACFYIDGYNYQENVLPRIHKKMGNDVQILASTETFIQNKCLGYCEPGRYKNEDGILVVRIPYSKKVPYKIGRKLRIYCGIKEELETFSPEIIFLHDIQFLSIREVSDYIKEKSNIVVYADGHADFSNSARNWFSKNILHKIIWRRCAHIIEPYVKKFYGVLPARVEFMLEIYQLPISKTELLVMGADDDEVNEARDQLSKKIIREKYNIEEMDFLIVTGGKIDKEKKQVLLLMDAVKRLSDLRIKLLIFGSVIDELKLEIDRRCSDNIQYIGWIEGNISYKIFAAANLVVFPGRHSVYWEQVAGLGIPMIVKYWHGTDHVDVGGNVEFLMDDTVEEMEEKIKSVVVDSKKYDSMRIAAKKGIELFSYNNIARRCIEI